MEGNGGHGLLHVLTFSEVRPQSERRALLLINGPKRCPKTGKPHINACITALHGRRDDFTPGKGAK